MGVCRAGWSSELRCICTSAAEVYISIGKPAEATACTQEAANLFPMSHNVLYMRGQVAELRGNCDEAQRWYEEALSISPTHVRSMQRLVSAPLPPCPGQHPVMQDMELLCPVHPGLWAPGCICGPGC